MDLLKEALEPRWVTVQVTPAASVRAVSLEDTCIRREADSLFRGQVERSVWRGRDGGSAL